MTAAKPNPPEKKPSNQNWAGFDKHNKQHLQILSQCITYGWSKPHHVYGEVADLAILSDWLKSERSPVRKPLKEMEPKELTKIINALSRMILKLYYKF